MSASKRVLGGFLSTLAWLVLSIALVVTAANLIVTNLSHVGESAAGILKEVSADPAMLNSLLDEFSKGADPKLAREIEKNRTQIEETINSLASSADFQGLLSSTLDQISQAAINGSPSLSVDFSKIAAMVATKVNAAANETVIKQQNLDSLKPTLVNLSKQTKNITDVKNKLHLGLMIWLFWLLLLAVNFLIRGRVVLRTAGIQLASVGLLGMSLKLAAPAIIDKFTKNADMVAYQRKVIPEVITSLISPIFTLSIALLITGSLAIFVSVLLARKSQSAVL